MWQIWEMLRIIGWLGKGLIFITPLTLIVGIINAIKIDGQNSTRYKIMAIVSAYLIIIPLIF